MKVFYLYKKWSFLVLMNNLVIGGFLIYTKKIVFLRFDLNKLFFWIYSKKVRLETKKILKLKNFFWNN